MTDPLVVTHSDIATYLQCRRRWAWDFVFDYRKAEVSWGALACGTRVHKSLEHFYRTGGDAVAEHERLFRHDHDILEADPDAPPWALDQMYEDVIVGRNAVSAYMDWLSDEGADDEYTVEDVEQVIEVPMLDGRVLLRCKADIIFRRKDNGFLALNDFKTDGGMYGLREQLERSWQHSTYLIALRLKRPEEFVQEAYYTILKKVKNPKRVKSPMVERWRVPGTSRNAANKQAQLEVILSEMLLARDAVLENYAAAFPAPTQSCRYCEFKQPCEIADESPAASVEMLNANYIRGGRHARYK